MKFCDTANALFLIASVPLKNNCLNGTQKPLLKFMDLLENSFILIKLFLPHH